MRALVLLGLIGCTPIQGPSDLDGDLVADGDDCAAEDPAVGAAGEWYRDADEDGYGDDAGLPQVACDAPEGHVARAGDCDDGDAAVNPGVLLQADEDGDDYGAGPTFDACAGAGVTVGGDCDDTDRDLHPGAEETCDGVDQDCDGVADDDDATGRATWYTDADGDTYGDPDAATLACDAPQGHVADGTDCDDGDATSFPGAPEACDGVDHDCDGLTNEASSVGAPIWYADADADGFGDVEVAVAACDEPTGHVADATDCDDGDADEHPGADEYCDGDDDDCMGDVDEDDAVDALLWYGDGDGDGYGDPDVEVYACGLASTRTADAGDCDDADATVHPGGREVCDNGKDDDCDGLAPGCTLEGALATADADFRVEGTVDGDAGFQSVTLGDLDGDGALDLVGSQPLASAEVGVMGIAFGPLSSGVTSWDVQLVGDVAGMSAGSRVGAEGDLDGDGIVDLTISSPNDDEMGVLNSGALYLVYGQGRASWSGEMGLDVADAKILAEAPGDYLGAYGAYYRTHTSGGDLDGDGVDDLIVGSYEHNGGQGALWLVPGGIAGTFDLADATAKWEGSADVGGVGTSVAFVGDGDGDGYDDFAAGSVLGDDLAGDAGVVYVVRGAPTGTYAGTSSLESTVDRWVGTEPGGAFGRDVAPAGDLDGDGTPDLVACDYGADGVWWWCEGAVVLSAGVSGTVPISSAHATIVADGGEDGAGSGPVGAFDADGDGADDLLVGGVYGYYLFYGPVAGELYVPSDADATFGDAEGLVAGAGDLDGDGFDDLVIGEDFTSSLLHVYRGGGF